jgi:DNA-binding transcriptional MerR regulator
MYTISKLGSLFNLSRSTLLYYDRNGLLSPSARSPVGYRLYSEDDKTRLQQIVLFRDIGIPLTRIKEYLTAPQDGVIPLLLKRLLAINNQINDFRSQQQAILEMIESEGSLKGAKPFLEKFRALGQKAGISQGNYKKIHGLFESASPNLHRRFLAMLGFTGQEIKELLANLKK